MDKSTIIIRGSRQRQVVLGKIADLDLTKPWKVTIEPETKRRTLSQNSLMWKWITEVVRHVHEHSGHDKDEIHEWFKVKWAPVRIVDIGGQAKEYRSTKNMTTAEMSEYMEKIYAWAISEGYFLPVPEDLGRAA